MGQAEVSVVTNRTADDANGCNIDGEEYYVTRFFCLTFDQTVKVGRVAQAPIGRGGARHFREFLAGEQDHRQYPLW